MDVTLQREYKSLILALAIDSHIYVWHVSLKMLFNVQICTVYDDNGEGPGCDDARANGDNLIPHYSSQSLIIPFLLSYTCPNKPIIFCDVINYKNKRLIF